MLTGDNRTTAAYVAMALGIDDFQAELLPEDKVRLVNQTRQEVRRRAAPGALALTPRGAARIARGVGVIGDGVNDAPALAAADVSIAIGSIGSDAALESADIVLLNDNLLVIPWAVRLSRRTRAIVLFNIALALTIIAGMGLATLIGSRLGWNVPLSVAVLAHEGGTLLVVANSLRLLLIPAPRAVGGDALEEVPDLEPAAIAAT
jgi:Cd2+/Zn2+-exporting ATPase